MADDPVLPYAGTSGWSGTDTSHERANTADADGTTSARQRRVRTLLVDAGAHGMNVTELGKVTGWHHGAASGILSVLHKAGVLDRLTERRGKCKVYVSPGHVDGRDTEHQGRTKPTAPAPSAQAAAPAAPTPVPTGTTRQVYPWQVVADRADIAAIVAGVRTPAQMAAVHTRLSRVL